MNYTTLFMDIMEFSQLENSMKIFLFIWLFCFATLSLLPIQRIIKLILNVHPEMHIYYITINFELANKSENLINQSMHRFKMNINEFKMSCVYSLYWNASMFHTYMYIYKYIYAIYCSFVQFGSIISFDYFVEYKVAMCALYVMLDFRIVKCLYVAGSYYTFLLLHI